MREWPLWLRWCWSHAIQDAVGRRSADAEEVGEFWPGCTCPDHAARRGVARSGFSFGCLPRRRPLAFAAFIYPLECASRSSRPRISATMAFRVRRAVPGFGLVTAWQLRGVGSSEVGRVQALTNAR